MILANYAQQNRNTIREWGIAFSNPCAAFKPGLPMRFYQPDTAQDGRSLSAFYHGYHTHHAYSLPLKSGGIASTLNIRGSGSISSATALAVKLAAADLLGSGELSATGGLIVQALASLVGSGGITAGNLQAFLAAVASISGSGGITAADLEGFAAILAALTGTGTTVTSTLTGRGAMTADIVVEGAGLTTSNVGDAVWSALASANDQAGTMGELLGNSGAGANPWTVELDGSYTAADLMRLISAAMAGKLSGAGTSEITIRDVNDTKDRIVADVDGDGNRTAITLDPTE